MSEMNKDLALKALNRLNELLEKTNSDPIRLIVGGGGSMILAHNFPGYSGDIDGMSSSDLEEIKPTVHQVAREQGLLGDWLNPHYRLYTHYLPQDYGNRLIRVMSGSIITVDCLGAEDLLVMKIMAGRSKDASHIMHLLSQNEINFNIIEDRLEELVKNDATKKVAEKALLRYYKIIGE